MAQKYPENGPKTIKKGAQKMLQIEEDLTPGTLPVLPIVRFNNEKTLLSKKRKSIQAKNKHKSANTGNVSLPIVN